MYMICLSFNVNLCIMAAPGVKNKIQQKEYKINLQQWPPSEELQICMSELSCRFSNKLQCKLMKNLGQNKWITKSHLILHCLSMWPWLCSGKAEGNRVQWYWLSVWLYWDDEHYDYLRPLIASVMSTDVITRCDKCKSTQSSHHFYFINSLSAPQIQNWPKLKQKLNCSDRESGPWAFGYDTTCLHQCGCCYFGWWSHVWPFWGGWMTKPRWANTKLIFSILMSCRKWTKCCSPVSFI